MLFRSYAVGDWNGWGDGTPLEPQGSSGIWAGVCAEAHTGHRYKYAVVQRSGATVLKADPVAQQTELPPSTASVVPSPDTYGWGDQHWMSSRSRAHGVPLRIYEVHLGSWRPWLTNYRQIAEELADHVGSSREVVSRILKDWEERKALEISRGSIRLLEGFYKLGL